MPFVCLPTGHKGGPALAGPKGAQRGAPGRARRTKGLQTDRQTPNTRLVFLVVQVWQPPLRGCTWGPWANGSGDGGGMVGLHMGPLG